MLLLFMQDLIMLLNLRRKINIFFILVLGNLILRENGLATYFFFNVIVSVSS